MEMQGKSTSGDTPSLDADKAEQAASSFRPAWEADASATSESPLGLDGPTIVQGSAAILAAPAPAVDASPQAPAVIVGAPVIAIGAGENVSPSNALGSTMNVPIDGGEAPSPPRHDGAPSPPRHDGAPSPPTPLGDGTLSPPTQRTIVGGISAEAAAIVAAANAAARAAATSPDPPNTERAIATATAAVAPAPVASGQKTRAVRAPIPFAATDPFRSGPVSANLSGDFEVVKKHSPARFVAIAVGGCAVVGALLFFKFGTSSNETKPPTSSETRIEAKTASTNDDIPAPPPKDEVPPANTTVTPKAAQHKPTEPSLNPTKTDPPPRAAATTSRNDAKPAQGAPPTQKGAPLAPLQPSQPKTPPKSAGGGIVRDSPF